MTTLAPQAASAHHGTSTGGPPKEVYRAFCQQETTVPLFARDWWLDAAVGADGWDVALVSKEGKVIASMPYVLHSRFRLAIVTQPALTPVLGPWLRQTGGKTATQVSHEKELMQALIDQLPPFDHFAQTWHSSIRNWQPFYWNGFQQTTFYTYVLPDVSDPAKVWDGFESKLRRTVNKARTAYQLEVRDDLPLDDMLALNRKTFERQGIAPPYPDAFVRRLDAACRERGCSKSFIAVDPNGVRHAGCYMVWDEHCAYGLIAGADPQHRASGGNSLAMWASIQYAASVTRQFNFSGSMIEPFEIYLRSFGGEHVPYFHISKTRSRLLRARQGVLSLIGNK